MRSVGPAVAGIVMCAGLLSGCAEDPPEPSTIGDTRTTSREPSPTPTPTSTLSAEEQDAVEAATAAYHRFYEVFSRLSRAPQDYTVSEMKTELYKVGGDPLAGDMLQILGSYRENRWMERGQRTVSEVDPEGVKVEVDESMGEYPEVKLRVCVNVSGLELLNEQTGEPVDDSSAQTEFVTKVKLWHYEDAWHLVEDQTPNREAEC